jgi:hypothetical protein
MRPARDATWKGGINVFIVLVGRPEEKRPFERTMCRREDNIKMNLSKCSVKA